MSAGKQDADLSSRIGAAAESDKPLVSPPDEDPDLSVGLPEHKLEFEVRCLQQGFDQLSDNHDLRLSYTGLYRGDFLAGGSVVNLRRNLCFAFRI